MRDQIVITDLQLRCSFLDVDHWGRPSKEQPLVCNVLIDTDISDEASVDNLLPSSCNYGSIAKAIEKVVREARPAPEQAIIPLEVLAEQVASAVLAQGAPETVVTLERPRAFIPARSIGVTLRRSKEAARSLVNADRFIVRDLELDVIIGLNEPERYDTQRIVVNLDFESPGMSHSLANAAWSGWKTTLKQIVTHLHTREAGTIESLCEDVAKIALQSRTGEWSIDQATVSIAKPHALMFAKHPAVSIVRNQADLTRHSLRSFTTSTTTSKTPVVLGVGSNVGQRYGNIRKAMRELESLNIKVVNTSFLYESEPMYVADQDPFLNAVVMAETEQKPAELLKGLKEVESRLDRQKTVRNGPRTIDLDILFYGDEAVQANDESEEGWLTIPHKSIAEREFVLRPLNDVAPGLRHAHLPATPLQMLASLSKREPRSTLHRVMPLSDTLVHPLPSLSTSQPTSQRTLIMSIMNVTPDSFSDGGKLGSVEEAVAVAKKHIAAGADILDIGGMSTRPGAADISPDEEAGRVVPAIRALRGAGIRIPISIDTFRPSVARAAIEAGADIINDVMGGREPGMLETMAELDVPVVLMHSRGTPQTMSKMTEYPEGVLSGVRKEMQDMVDAALQAGIKRWNIILDPGIGFAKTADQNLLLLRHLREKVLRDDLGQYPILVGLSRKKFIGIITGKSEARERVHGTSAGITLSIQQGAHIVRVHDTQAAVDVVRMTDAILGGASDPLE